MPYLQVHGWSRGFTADNTRFILHEFLFYFVYNIHVGNL